MNCFSAIASCGPTTGFNTGWALLMLPEPISANHSQMEARLTYARDKFSISAGYYGSFYRNDYSTRIGCTQCPEQPVGKSVELSSGLQALLSQPVALTPDNQAHQLDVAGKLCVYGHDAGNVPVGLRQCHSGQQFCSRWASGPPPLGYPAWRAK